MFSLKSIVPALALTLVAATACGSKQNTATTAAVKPAAGTGSKTATKQAVVDGELREAILKLRRIHFAYDNAVLSSEVQSDLTDAADKLNRHPDVHIYIEGNTDERGTAEYNIALGERRAQAVVDYLVRMGIAPDRMHIVSFGKERLMDEGTGDLANAKNRRVEFRLMRGDVQLVIEEGHLLDDRGKPLSADSRPAARKGAAKPKAGARVKPTAP